jgi:hypothetical protein
MDENVANGEAEPTAWTFEVQSDGPVDEYLQSQRVDLSDILSIYTNSLSAHTATKRSFDSDTDDGHTIEPVRRPGPPTRKIAKVRKSQRERRSSLCHSQGSV